MLSNVLKLNLEECCSELMFDVQLLDFNMKTFWKPDSSGVPTQSGGTTGRRPTTVNSIGLIVAHENSLEMESPDEKETICERERAGSSISEAPDDADGCKVGPRRGVPGDIHT